MHESDLLDELRRRLPEILPLERIRWSQEKAIDGKRVDMAVEGVLAGRRVLLLIDGKARPSAAGIVQAAEQLQHYRNARAHRAGGRDVIGVLAAPHFGPSVRSALKARGQAYLDLSGNAWLAHGNVLIEKEVAKNLYPEDRRSRSPFADRASFVLRFLFSRPDSKAGVREIAESVGLSPGYVSKVVKAAAAKEYVGVDESGRPRLKNHEEILDDWSSFYDWRRNRRESYFCKLRSPEEIGSALKRSVGASEGCALSLHLGNNRIEPFASSAIFHIYVREEAVEGRLKKALSLSPVPEDAGNVVLLRPYYRDSALFDARVVGGLQVVSDLQLWLDLRRYPLRGIEAAERILVRRLRPLWERKRGRA